MSDSLHNINPGYRRHAPLQLSIAECLAAYRSSKQILSYLISKAESHKERDAAFLVEFIQQLHPYNKTKTRRIAISGAPGVGKSTFINAYGHQLLTNKNKIAILPVDPTSGISKGSILGDKTRMEDLTAHPAVFIKPMASALALGGVAPATHLAIQFCEAAGYQTIIVETVGVGQSEYEVRKLVDMFILLQQPGGGDELQGIKRGIMEIADLIVVSKADGDLQDIAQRSRKAYANALHLSAARETGWVTPVLAYSALRPDTVLDLVKEVNRYFVEMNQTGHIERLRQQQEEGFFADQAKKMMLRRLMAQPEIDQLFQELKADVGSYKLTALEALNRLEKKVNESR